MIRPGGLRPLGILARVPDVVADTCAHCGAPWNRPLGSEHDLCTACTVARYVPLERVEDVESERDTIKETLDTERDDHRDLAKELDRVEHQVRELLVILRDIDGAVAHAPPSWRTQVNVRELRARLEEILGG